MYLVTVPAAGMIVAIVDSIEKPPLFPPRDK
jgi:hypothetical protein